MTRRSISAAITAIACAGFVATYWANAQPPKPEAAAGDKAESLDVQYAKAYRDIAQLQFDMLHQASLAVRGSVLKEKKERMARVVAFANASYAAAVAEQNGNTPAAAYAKQTESMAKQAEQEYDAAREELRRRVGSKSAAELKPAALKARLARLRAEKAMAVAGKGTVEYLSWRVDLLGEQLMSAVEP